MTNSRSDNVISLKEWKAQHQRKPVMWTYYEVVLDPNGDWRLELIERKPKLELE